MLRCSTVAMLPLATTKQWKLRDDMSMVMMPMVALCHCLETHLAFMDSSVQNNSQPNSKRRVVVLGEGER